MNGTVRYTFRYLSPLGGITMASDGEALTGLWFDGQKHFGAGLAPGCREMELPVFDAAAEWLDIYFSGREPYFTPPLSPQGTVFQRTVWDVLRGIPRGRTMTYGEVAAAAAERLGLERMAAQAAGGAVGRNPVSIIIPCHRVVGADGSLTGYAGGIEKKLALLELEGVDTGLLRVPEKN